MRKVYIFCFLSTIVLAFGTSCGVIDQLLTDENINKVKKVAKMPTMTHKSTLLVQNPTEAQVAAYFCPQYLTSLVCEVALGSPPPKKDLRFDFQLTFTIKNPNDLPIPTVSMLVALNVFKGLEASKLGSVCVEFCKKDEPNCQNSKPAEACARGKQKTISSWEDVAEGAARGLLNIALDKLDGSYKGNKTIRTIPAGGEADLKITFSLGIDPTLDILYKVLKKYITELVIDGKDPDIIIPYEIKGSIWLDLPYEFGRFGLGFGPIQSTWKLQ